MSLADKQAALNKIKKLLDRAKCPASAPNEAASALKQARALMEAWQVTDGELLATEAHEARGASRAEKPPTWEAQLVSQVARIFGCHALRTTRLDPAPGRFALVHEWCFISTGPAPEIAQYAYTVLRRQCLKARSTFIKAKCKRLKPSTKTRRGDLYCEGWVGTATGQLTRWVSSPGQDQAIAAYLELHYSQRSTLETRNRSDGASLRTGDHRAYGDGHRDGKAAVVNQGVGVSGAAKRISHQGGSALVVGMMCLAGLVVILLALNYVITGRLEADRRQFGGGWRLAGDCACSCKRPASGSGNN